MRKKRLPESPTELKGWAADFLETIKAESDRGCVLVAAAFLDEALELLLRSRMSSEATVLKRSVEPLFVGEGALRSFGTKTELCHAFRLLPDYEYADLTRIRKLRNLFAHSYFNANFEDQRVIQIISELRHFGMKEFPTQENEKQCPDYARRRFSMAAAWLAGKLHDRAGMVG